MIREDRADNDPGFSDLDLHFGRFMSRLAGAEQAELAAAAALASRATANGDVCVHLADYAERTLPGLAVAVPSLARWLPLLRGSRVVGAPGEFRPLVLDESGRLYLYRYWEHERRLAENLLR